MGGNHLVDLWITQILQEHASVYLPHINSTQACKMLLSWGEIGQQSKSLKWYFKLLVMVEKRCIFVFALWVHVLLFNTYHNQPHGFPFRATQSCGFSDSQGKVQGSAVCLSSFVTVVVQACGITLSWTYHPLMRTATIWFHIRDHGHWWYFLSFIPFKIAFVDQPLNVPDL